jgi:hypothetical protein
MIDKIFKRLSWYLFLGIGILLSFILATSGYYGLLVIFILSIGLNYGIQTLIIKWLVKSLKSKGKKADEIPDSISECWEMYTIKKEKEIVESDIRESEEAKE